jgi:NTP pyrophosphatase (non-canonical NTP hydrolase)
MNLKEAALHCEKAWSQFAEKFQIHRDDEFYLFKMQEELGELTRAFLELRGSEKTSKTTAEELKKQLASDIASLVGNALILALHFDVDLEATIKHKFPIA